MFEVRLRCGQGTYAPGTAGVRLTYIRGTSMVYVVIAQSSAVESAALTGICTMKKINFVPA